MQNKQGSSIRKGGSKSVSKNQKKSTSKSKIKFEKNMAKTTKDLTKKLTKNINIKINDVLSKTFPSNMSNSKADKMFSLEKDILRIKDEVNHREDSAIKLEQEVTS